MADKCKCSERPLGILSSRYEVKDGYPWQVLKFGCTNKKCAEYKKPVYELWINLQTNAEETIYLKL